ncbi:unnamed protein product [Bursaphelenchus xylophilus]|uniref:(pine wood nematode) hypothetical protein n=1 Tax=Bursaphelenchus xylophilus TaxID=6326 RepID=A0A7I8XAR1_BURXY|nr:unnamed protein product [Bursaphelenchus xylophilus]CAG9132089.1 unnamed protein product [Bursaphelenchus xylophilus]
MGPGTLLAASWKLDRVKLNRVKQKEIGQSMEAGWRETRQIFAVKKICRVSVQFRSVQFPSVSLCPISLCRVSVKPCGGLPQHIPGGVALTRTSVRSAPFFSTAVAALFLPQKTYRLTSGKESKCREIPLFL